MSFTAWVDKKDPQDISDWDLDWTDRLIDTETLVSAVWSITKMPTNDASHPLAIDSTSSEGTGLSKVWLSGGVKGTYNLTCHVTTSGGREYDQTKVLKVAQL